MKEKKNKVEQRKEYKCEVLQEIILHIKDLYDSEDNEDNEDKSEEIKDKKNFIETLIGAGIFYLGGGQAMYGGYISEKALKQLNGGKELKDLVKDHRYPRKQSAKKLLKSDYKKFDEKSLLVLYKEEYGKYNYVTKAENNELKKASKKFSLKGKNDDWKILYKYAEVEPLPMELEELKKIVKENDKKNK